MLGVTSDNTHDERDQTLVTTWGHSILTLSDTTRRQKYELSMEDRSGSQFRMK